MPTPYKRSNMKYITLLLMLAVTSTHAEGLSGSIGVTNAYMSRGTEQNVYHEPAVLGFVTYEKNGFYVSAFAANMNYGEGTTFELDGFGGYRFPAGEWLIDVGFAAINYPSSPNMWNFVEYDIKADRPVGKGSFGIWLGYTDAYFYSYGQGVWSEAHGSYPINDKVSVSASVAYQDLNDGWSYATYNVGTTISLAPTVLLDVRYSDTNQHDLDPLFGTYNDRLAVTLTKLF